MKLSPARLPKLILPRTYGHLGAVAARQIGLPNRNPAVSIGFEPPGYNDRMKKLPLLALAPLVFFLRCQAVGGGGTDLIGAAFEGGRSTNGSMAIYTIAADGRLTPGSKAAIEAGTRVAHAAGTADGRFLYVASFTTNEIFQFSVSGNVPAALTPASIETEAGPRRLAVHPGGKFLYASNYSNSTISQYAIGGDGTLSELVPATVTVSAPLAISMTSDGKYLYAAGLTGIYQFSIGGSGILTPLNIPIVTLPGAVEEVVVSVDLRAYALQGNNVYQYNVGGDGKLAAMTLNSVSSGGILPSRIAIAPNGKWLYVTNTTGNNVGQFTISAATATPGAITAMTPATVTTGAEPVGIVVSADSRYLYVANRASGTLSQYSIGQDGKLTPLASPTVTAPDTNPEALFRFKSP